MCSFQPDVQNLFFMENIQIAAVYKSGCLIETPLLGFLLAQQTRCIPSTQSLKHSVFNDLSPDYPPFPSTFPAYLRSIFPSEFCKTSPNHQFIRPFSTSVQTLAIRKPLIPAQTTQIFGLILAVWFVCDLMRIFSFVTS